MTPRDTPGYVQPTLERLKRQERIEMALEEAAEQAGYREWRDMTDAELIEFIDFYAEHSDDTRTANQ